MFCRRFKSIIALLIICSIIMSGNAFAYNIVSYDYQDSGMIEASYLKQGRETDKTVRYAPWFVNYALQTEKEAESVQGGEGFQQISDIAVSPADNNLMLMGTDTCGIWRSTDGGANWLSVNDGVNCWGVHDIAFHPNNQNIAFMIQGGPNASESTLQIQERTTLDGLYKSEDGGKSWIQILDVNIRSSVSTNRLIAFDNDANLYLLTSEGLLKSLDLGATWSVLYDFYEELKITHAVNYDLCISGDIIVFTNSEFGVIASTDGGLTWNRRNIDSVEAVAAYGIDIDPENPGRWLVCFGSPYYEVYETVNSGVDWNLLPVGADAEPASGKHPSKIMFGKRNEAGIRKIYMLFSAVYTPLRVSSDEGTTWSSAVYTTPWAENYLPLYGNAISLEHSDSDTVFLGVGTVLKSTDGGQSFVARNTPGYSGANVEEIKISDSGRLYLSVTDRGFYKSEAAYADGIYPTFQHTRDQSYSAVGDIGVDPDNENHIIYAECADSYALRESNDGGLTWSKIAGTEASAAPKVIDFHDEKENVIYSTYFTSRDGGKSWSANEKNIYAVSKANNDIVYSYTGKILYKSSDCGETFSELYTASWNITYVLPDNTKEDVVYIGMKNGNVVKFEDGSAVVWNVNNGLGNVAPYAMAQNPSDSRHLVIGGRCVDYSTANNAYYDNYCKTPGIYETYDGGTSWHIVKGMPSMRVVYSLEFSACSNEIFIGGFTGGLIVYDYEIYRKYFTSENSIENNFTVVYNGSTGKATVSGRVITNNTEGVYSTLLVLPADVMPNNAQMSDIAYLGQIPVDSDGSFEYSFEMPADCQFGVYNVYLGGSGVYLPGIGEYNTSDYSIVSFCFEDSDDITVSAAVVNTKASPEPLVLIIAQYQKDASGNMKFLRMDSKSYTIDARTESPVIKSLSAAVAKETSYYKAFAWSGMQKIVPLTDFIENDTGVEKNGL